MFKLTLQPHLFSLKQVQIVLILDVDLLQFLPHVNLSPFQFGESRSVACLFNIHLFIFEISDFRLKSQYLLVSLFFVPDDLPDKPLFLSLNLPK